MILSGSYSVATGTVTETGFEYGLTESALTTTLPCNGTSSPFSYPLSDLTLGTTYYYRAYVKVKVKDTETSVVETFTGETLSFTVGGLIPATLEAPATKKGYTHAGHGSGTSRNYNYCYDNSHYAALWVAYPLTYAHTQGTASNSNWEYDSKIDTEYQPAITSKSYETIYGNGAYSRGHQCPNASRKSDNTMNAQTYYATNQTPQLQQKFNSGIWSKLEGDVRSLTSGSDTLYVATGPCYQTVGGNETVNYLTAVSSTTTPQQVPVPNYYWKAILKIKTTNGYITDACAVGIWLEHKAYEDSDYTPYIVSIDDIESKTGFDLFAGLPEYLEAAVEAAKPSWSDFSSF